MENESEIISQSDDILITAIGIPTVDIIVKLKNADLLDKFDISLDTHRPSSLAFIKQMEEEIYKYSADIGRVTGGCAQNTLKIFQWLIKTKYKSAMIGAIGYDEDGFLLQRDLQDNGIIPLYVKIPDARTSFVYAFTCEKNVSYVYDLMTTAARQYSIDHLKRHENAQFSIQNSKIVLFEAFFTSLSVDINLHILQTCIESNSLTVFNLSGEYIPLEFPNAVLPFVENCDIVIGNKMEFFSLCQAMNVSTNEYKRALTDVHKTMLLQRKHTQNAFKVEAIKTYRKILLVTDGKKPVNCVYGFDSEILEYRLSPVESTLVQDPTGAGDSFLAGFLYGILENFSIEKCLDIGHGAASEIIKLSGCVVPNTDSSNVINIR